MKKTYRVTGTLPVYETPPGSTFVAELDPEQEARLLESGSITRVNNDAPKPDPVSKKKE